MQGFPFSRGIAMQNSICLSERNETSLAKSDSFSAGEKVKNTITVKELASELKVSDQTIRNAVKELYQDPTKLLWTVINGGQTLLLTYEQATAIKLKLRERNNLKDNSVVSQIGNDLEFFAILKRREEEQKILDAYRDRRIEELQAQNEMQKAMIEEMQPKSDVYDSISDSATLQDLQTAAVTIGIKNIFKILEADGIIEKKTTNDGQAYYKPIAKYAEYLALKDGKAWTDPYGVKHVRPRIFVTGKGLLWLTKKYGAEK